MMQTLPNVDTWLHQQFQHSQFSVQALTGDASMRCYYRVRLANEHSFVLLHSPPSEPLKPFLDVAVLLQDIGIHVPFIYHKDEQQGFALLRDLGDTHYLETLTAHNADLLYNQAFYPLLWMQERITPDHCVLALPQFSPSIMETQLGLFQEWYLKKHLSYPLTAPTQATLHTLFKKIVHTVAAQPYVFTHMDYHSRNLMVSDKGVPGVLDFQDALWGPVTLDLVSLLKDCYIAWPREQIISWVHRFYQLKQKRGQQTYAFQTFLRWFDWTGVQRHLRILGTFSRLHHLYGKSGYLKNMPLILRYLTEMCDVYPELTPLRPYLTEESPVCVP